MPVTLGKNKQTNKTTKKKKLHSCVYYLERKGNSTSKVLAEGEAALSPPWCSAQRLGAGGHLQHADVRSYKTYQCGGGNRFCSKTHSSSLLWKLSFFGNTQLNTFCPSSVLLQAARGEAGCWRGQRMTHALGN